jgi:hypothetical protein
MKFKVDRQKFIDAVNYLKEIEKYNLADLDLLEFFDNEVELLSEESDEGEVVYGTLKDAIQIWEHMGLTNKHFILYALKWKEEIKKGTK